MAGTSDDNDVANHPYHVYLLVSRDHGHTWSHPIQVDHDPNGAGTHVLPHMAVTSPGNVDVVWYGTSVRGDPGTFPSWFSDRAAATTVPWHVYLAQIQLNFGAPASSTIYQARATEHRSGIVV